MLIFMPLHTCRQYGVFSNGFFLFMFSVLSFQLIFMLPLRMSTAVSFSALKISYFSPFASFFTQMFMCISGFLPFISQRIFSFFSLNAGFSSIYNSSLEKVRFMITFYHSATIISIEVYKNVKNIYHCCVP